tara:strand:- start:3408 stop:4106 length:699 start_codon:yes stop_codon:yes gene_type:complete
MITLQKHIELQRIIESGGNIEALFHGLTDAEGHLLADDIEDSYPIVDNLLKPTFTKKIYYSVEEMVFGQFIMVEQILTGKMGMNNHTADLELAKLLIRPLDNLVFDNEDGHKEVDNENDILSYDVREIYYILERFTKRRNKTMFEDYSGVFYDPKEDEEDEDTLEDNSGPNFHQQWYYYSLVRMLANEDITKYDEIYMLPMKSVLPEMSYLSQKRKIDDAESRKQSALSKMK